MLEQDAIAIATWAENVIKYHRAHVSLVRAQMIGGFLCLCLLCPVLLYVIAERWAAGLVWFLPWAVSVWTTAALGGRLRRCDRENEEHVRALGVAAAGLQKPKGGSRHGA